METPEMKARLGFCFMPAQTEMKKNEFKQIVCVEFLH